MNTSAIKILLIEDNPGDARLIKGYLSSTRQEKYSLIWKDNLLDAKTFLKTNKIDAILLDLNLSDSVGAETINSMCLDMTCEPVIIISNLQDEELARHAVQSGAQDYILKDEINSFNLQRSILFAIERKNYQRSFTKIYKNHFDVEKDENKFLSIIAHDLRSPLHGLIGLTELIVTEFDSLPIDEVKKYIHDLHGVAKNQFSLLENLLNWTLMKAGKFELNPSSVKLKQTIDNAMNAVKYNALEKQILLINNVAEDNLLIADEKMLNSLFQNLIANAIKFTAREGKVEISAIHNNGNIEILVNDSGTGMTREQVNNLFAANGLSTTLGTAKERGSGFGLKLCKEFIDAHGGSIVVQSELGEGTTVKISLPRKIDEGNEKYSTEIKPDDSEYVFG